MPILSRLGIVAILSISLNALADAPASAPAIGFHTHPGDEFGYVLKGPLVLKTKGQPDRMLKTGDFFFNARGVVHSLATVSGGEGGTALSTWMVDKGETLATPVTN